MAKILVVEDDLDRSGQVKEWLAILVPTITSPNRFRLASIVFALALLATVSASAKDKEPKQLENSDQPNCALPPAATPTAKQKKAVLSMVGRFAGSCEAGDGTVIPTETEFSPDAAAGVLKGTYVMEIEGKKEKGMLSEGFVSKSGRDVTFRWEDAYGYGNLTITFNGDYSKFDGKWTGLYDKATGKINDSPRENPWSGVRQTAANGTSSGSSSLSKSE